MTSALRIKSGRPSDAFRNDPLLIHKFNGISVALGRELKLTVSEQTLADISYKVQLFMEEKMGKTADREAVTLVRLPRKLFYDFREYGSLYVILQIAVKRMKPTAWAVYDVLNPNNCPNMCALVAEMDQQLQEKGILRRPVIYFSTDLSPTLISELSTIATRHGASVVELAEEATHVVIWDEEVDGASADELVDDFIRPLELRPNQGQGVALVHWWYYPDSYDEWIPSAEVECRDVPEDPEGDFQALGQQWRVSCRFVRDVAVFNEWGNELDYEKESEAEGEEGAPESLEVTASGGRRGRGKKGRSDKQRRVERAPILEAVLATEKMVAYLPPPTDDPKFQSQAGGMGAVVVDVQGDGSFKVSVSGSQQAETSDRSGGEDEGRMEECEGSDVNTTRVKKRKDMDTSPSLLKTEMDDSNAGGGPLQKLKRQLLLNDGAGEGRGLETAGLVNDFPSWYSPQGVSTVELRYLPELLAPALHLGEAGRIDEAEGAHRGDYWVPAKESLAVLGTKTCQRYMAVRNFIVNLYRENPTMYLTATECRQLVAGEAAFTMRIHEFLDTFDLINYSSAIKPSSRPLKSPAYFTSCPTVREIEDHCSAFRSSSQADCGASVTEEGKAEGSTPWTEASDRTLLATITSALTVEEGSTEKNVDWNKVSSDMAGVMSWTPSAHDCFTRFVEMTLPPPARAKGAALDPAHVHKRVMGGGWNGKALSKQLHCAAAVLAAACVSKLDYETALSVVSAVNSAVKITGDVQGGVAEVAPAEAKKTVKGHSRAKGDVPDDYMSLRLVALEEKVKLVSEVEKRLQIERDRLELDRRDLQLQRAELAFYQPM